MIDYGESEESDESDAEPLSRKQSSKKIWVSGTNNKPRQHFDKRDICFYCKISVLSTSLADHLARKHGSEDFVVETMDLPKRDPTRRKRLQVIRNKGNFEHNKSVLRNGGYLIVVQRPTATKEITDDIDTYAACNLCYGFYCREEINRHTCPVIQSGITIKKLLPSHIVPTKPIDVDLAVFFGRMFADKLTSIAKEDETIREFVKQEVDAKGMKSFNTIANKTRLLSEFLDECRKCSGQNDLSLAMALTVSKHQLHERSRKENDIIQRYE